MQLTLGRAARTLVAVVTAISSNGCMAAPSGGEITSLQIVRLDVPADARGEPRQWRVIEPRSRAASLAVALGRCTTQDFMKFRGKYRVDATRANGSETTFFVSHDYVRIDGVAFKCRQNIQELIERLWADEPAAPR